MTAWAGSDTDHPSGEHLIFFNRPVTESVKAQEADTEEPLVMNVSTVAYLYIKNVALRSVGSQ